MNVRMQPRHRPCRWPGLLLAGVVAMAAAGPPEPEVLYAARCAVCHSLGVFAPTRQQLSRLTAEEINNALWHGVMQELANGLTAPEREALALWLGKGESGAGRDHGGQLCEDTAPVAPVPVHWRGFSADNSFSRHLPAATVPRADRLQVKWAFAFPDTTAFTGVGNQIAAAGNTLFVANLNGWVYALDAHSGCTRWSFRAEGRVRANVAIEDGLLVFGDLLANVYALDVSTGRLRWRVRVDSQPSARVTGNVTLHEGRVYVPVSGMQEVLGMRMDLPCCTFRGSVVALDAVDGRQLWKSWMIAEPAGWIGKSPHGVDRFGPSGVPVWSGISVDPDRGVVYVSNGNQFTEPRVETSDAVVALDMATGERRWVQPLAPESMGGQDIYHVACEAWFDPDRSTCSPANPKGEGDRDFGAPPVLVTRADGTQIVAAGSKDGVLYALDPDNGGAVLWQLRVGVGGELGGIEYGIASDGRFIWAPVIDMDADGVSNGSLTAVDAMTGKPAWRVENIQADCTGKPTPPCGTGFVSPPTIAGDTVLAGLIDGTLRAYDRASGVQRWQFDTARGFPTRNGIEGHGGSLGIGGPIIVDGTIYLVSGWGMLNVGLPGNLLIAIGEQE